MRRTKLITALRTAATALENGTFPYRWNDTHTCNCGVVACALLGKSPATIRVPHVPEKKTSTWSERVGYHCPITGIPANKFFATLLRHGLTPVDLVQLEYLSNPKVVARMNLRTTQVVRTGFLWLDSKEVEVPVEANYQSKDHLVRYLRAWAQILVEEGALDGSEQEQASVEPHLTWEEGGLMGDQVRSTPEGR